jgi:hypothetical protein
MDRKKVYELLKEPSLKAAEIVEDEDENPLPEYLMQEGEVINLIGRERIRKALHEAPKHYGEAPKVCDEFLGTVLYPAIGKTT